MAATVPTIPNSITSIEDHAFGWSPSLNSIINLNPVPLEISSEVFAGVNQSTCTLKVFMSAVSDYQNAEVWKDFNIIGYDYYVQVSTNNNEHGYVIGNELYSANATATVIATANTGYQFVNWTKDGVEVSTDNPYSFTVTEDVELVANFEEEVGVENFEPSNFKLYPNPTTGELRIESEGLKIENVVIYDISGKIQKIENWKAKNAIDISHLTAGIYFVKISTEAGEVTKKVLKE